MFHHRNKMMLEARLSALRIIAQTIRSVLREASSEALRRLVQERFKEHPIGNQDDESRNELTISQSDIEKCYEVAIRLAERWKEKLLESGESDAASIVRDVIENGHFLELDVIDEFPSNTPSQETTIPETRQKHNLKPYTQQGKSDEDLMQENQKRTPSRILLDLGWKLDLSQRLDQAFPTEVLPTGSHWKPLPALNQYQHETKLHIPKAAILPMDEIKAWPPEQLYGYPAPSFNLSYTHHDPSRVYSNQSCTFLQDQIDSIDSVFEDADEHNRPTSWYHGWGCIKRAANKNRHRMHLQTITGKKRKDSSGNMGINCHLIIPKSMVDPPLGCSDPENSQTNPIEDDCEPSRRQEEEPNFTLVPVIQLIASKKRVAHLLEDKSTLQRKRPQKDTNSGLRLPSSLSSQTWNMNTLIFELTEREKDQLDSLIVEDLESEYSKESQSHMIVGALKHLGLIHLWEKDRSEDHGNQVDSLNSSLLEENKNMQKKRARLVRKARKMRLWPRTLEKLEKTKGSNSKIMWSESLANDSDASNQNWMELDLGECMVQFQNGENGSSNHIAIAFRSLEISALM